MVVKAREKKKKNAMDGLCFFFLSEEEIPMSVLFVARAQKKDTRT